MDAVERIIQGKQNLANLIAARKESDTEQMAMGIAARIWGDPEMSHLTMDVKAAGKIAVIIERVITSQRR